MNQIVNVDPAFSYLDICYGNKEMGVRTHIV